MQSRHDGGWHFTTYDDFDTFIIRHNQWSCGNIILCCALTAILFTAVSYGKLVSFPLAGSAAYTYKSMRSHVGFMVGWSSLLDYLFMPMINILLAKIYLQAIFPGVDPWIFVVALVALMTFLIYAELTLYNKYRYCCYSSSCNGGICWFINSWRITAKVQGSYGLSAHLRQ